MYKVDHDYFLKELTGSGFTPEQARVMLSIMVEILGKEPLLNLASAPISSYP